MSGRQVRRRRPGVSLRLGPSFVRQRSSINDNGDRLAAAWKGIDRRRRDFIPRRALNILRRQVSHSTPACVRYLPTRRSSIACPPLLSNLVRYTPRRSLLAFSLSLPSHLPLSLSLTHLELLHLPAFVYRHVSPARASDARKRTKGERARSLVSGGSN